MTDRADVDLAAALSHITSRVRTDVTAVRIHDGTSRWTADRLTPQRLAKHLNGGPGRGVCPIAEGSSTTRLALFDMDSHKGQTDWPSMVAAAERLMAVMGLLGLRAIPFRSSGGRGVHLFALWDEPQDAYSVRQHLHTVLQTAGLAPGAGGVAKGQVEVFPKQDQVNKGERGNQFILPLAGKSEPLDPLFGLQPMGREWVLQMDWPLSEPVPVVPRPVRSDIAVLDTYEPIEKVRDALAAIPNDGLFGDLDYDTWFGVVCAVHEATGGSDEGCEAIADWSAQNPRHDGPFLEKRVYPYIKPADKRTNGITRATLFKMAHGLGWVEGTSAVGFPEVADVVDMEPEPEADQTERVAGTGGPVEEKEWPAFARDGRTGMIKSIVNNLIAAIRRPDITYWHIQVDTFREEIMMAPLGTEAWRPLTDADYVWLASRLETVGFEPIAKERLRDIVSAVAGAHKFDSAQLWLNSLPDDGGSRCETFLIDHFGASDTPYVRAVSLYMWTALAGRVLDPGCQVDMVPILVGAQGMRKSTAIRALLPSPEFFCHVAFTEKDDDLSRKMRGKLIAEIGELRGLQTKDQEAIKDFITQTHEHWVPKFKEFATQYPRRLLFIGTTNKDQFLADETGNRRWLPLRVHRQAVVSEVRAAAPHLWAEARRLYLNRMSQPGAETGVLWQEADRLAEAEHDQFMFSDAWDAKVHVWLAEPDLFDDEAPGVLREFVTAREVLVNALGYDDRQIARREEMRVGAILCRFGYKPARRYVGPRQVRGYETTQDNQDNLKKLGGSARST